MSEIVKRLRERREQVWNEAKALADDAAEENRAFNADEESKWQTLNAELDALDKRVKAVLDGEQRAKDTEDAYNKLEGKPVTGKRAGDQDGGQGGGGKSAELRSFLQGKGGRTYDVLPENGPVDFRTLSKLSAGAGANSVPITFYDRLMAHFIETSGVLQAGPTVLNTSSGEQIQIPKTTAHSAGAIVTEGAAIAASDPAFGQTPLGAFKYGCLIQVSRELLDDTGVDLEGYLSMQAGRALGNAFGAHMVTGTGTTQPRGIVTDATVGVTGPVGTSLSFGNQATVGQGGDLLIQLFYSVIAPYRNSSSAAWLVKDSTMGTLRQIKDTTGDYLVQGGLVGSTAETMMGKPIYTDPAMAAPGVSTASVVFGDFSQYFVRIAGGVRFERSDDFAFSTDLVTFRCLLRGDAALVDLTGAVKKFVHSTT